MRPTKASIEFLFLNLFILSLYISKKLEMIAYVRSMLQQFKPRISIFPSPYNSIQLKNEMSSKTII